MFRDYGMRPYWLNHEYNNPNYLNLITSFLEMHENPNLSLNSQIRFFSKFQPCHFFTLLAPNFMYSFEKTNERSLRYSKTEGKTDTKTDRQTVAMIKDTFWQTRGPKNLVSEIFIILSIGLQ